MKRFILQTAGVSAAWLVFSTTAWAAETTSERVRETAEPPKQTELSAPPADTQAADDKVQTAHKAETPFSKIKILPSF